MNTMRFEEFENVNEFVTQAWVNQGKTPKSQEVKLMIIENYIDWFSSDEKEREELKKSATTYVSEDHVDEIIQAYPELKK